MFKKINWWEVAGAFYTIVACINVAFIVYSLASTISAKDVSLMLATPFGALVFVGGSLLIMAELAAIVAIPYLYLNKKPLALRMTMIIYVFFEGLLKFVIGLVQPESLLVIGGAFMALVSLFFIRQISRGSKTPRVVPTHVPHRAPVKSTKKTKK